MGAPGGVTVIALEQAVAAPLATSRLADAGARVIKLERPEGDFARGYDGDVLGQSSYFVWNNRGKESCRVDLRREDDLALVDAMLAGADVFVQNLAPGAAERLGLGAAVLRARHRRLVVCDIGGFAPGTPDAARKACDLLIQAEAGLAGVTGSVGSGPSRVASLSATSRRARPPTPPSSRRFSGASARARARISRSRSSTRSPNT